MSKNIFISKNLSWPHGIIETEKTVPSPIFIAALTGSVNAKFVKLDATKKAFSFVQQMIDEIPNRVNPNGTIIAFGKPIGFVININPDYAIRYDLKGNKLEELNDSIQLGKAAIRF